MSDINNIRKQAFDRLNEKMESSPTLRESWVSTKRYLIQLGYDQAKEELASQWTDINLDPPKDKEMVVFRAFNVQQGTAGNYTSDPYCGWIQNNEYVRWPHPFPPTHYMKLP